MRRTIRVFHAPRQLIVSLVLTGALVPTSVGCRVPTPMDPAEPGQRSTSTISPDRAPAAVVGFALSGEGRLLEQSFAPGFPSPSSFGGRCSVPAHFVIRFGVRIEGAPLGRTRGVLEHCSVIDFQTGLATFVDGLITLRPLEGGTIDGTYEGGSTPTGFEDEVLITGGSDRFEGVSGMAVQSGACDRTTGICSYGLEGSLSFPTSGGPGADAGEGAS